MATIHQSATTGVEAEALRRLLDSATDRLSRSLQDFKDQFLESDDCKKNAGGKRAICKEALRYYRESVEPALRQVLAEDTERSNDWVIWQGRAAQCLAEIALQFQLADEFVAAEELTFEALALAQGASIEVMVEDGIGNLSELAAQQRKALAADAQKYSAIELVRQHCRAVETTVRNRLIAREGFAGPNRAVCRDELICLRRQIEPALYQAALLWPAGDLVFLQARGEVAVCVADIAVDHTWAGDWLGAQRLMQEAFRLCQHTPAADDVLLRFLQLQRSASDQKERTPVPPTIRRGLSIKGWVWVAVTTVAALTAWMVSGSAPANVAPPRSHEPPPASSQQAPPSVKVETPVVASPVVRSAQVPFELETVELQRQIDTLQRETMALKRDRAAGIAIDSLAYNAKLHELARLQQRLHGDPGVSAGR